MSTEKMNVFDKSSKHSTLPECYEHFENNPKDFKFLREGDGYRVYEGRIDQDPHDVESREIVVLEEYLGETHRLLTNVARLKMKELAKECIEFDKDMSLADYITNHSSIYPTDTVISYAEVDMDGSRTEYYMGEHERFTAQVKIRNFTHVLNHENLSDIVHKVVEFLVNEYNPVDHPEGGELHPIFDISEVDIEEELFHTDLTPLCFKALLNMNLWSGLEIEIESTRTGIKSTREMVNTLDVSKLDKIRLAMCKIRFYKNGELYFPKTPCNIIPVIYDMDEFHKYHPWELYDENHKPAWVQKNLDDFQNSQQGQLMLQHLKEYEAQIFNDI